MSSRLPAAFSQLSLNCGSVETLPEALVMCRPGQLTILVGSSIQPLIGLIWARTKTTMMIAYGAHARTTSPRESGCATRPANSGVGSSAAPPATTGVGSAPPSVSPGCQTRSSATSTITENSDATMSVSGTERWFEVIHWATPKDTP